MEKERLTNSNIPLLECLNLKKNNWILRFGIKEDKEYGGFICNIVYFEQETPTFDKIKSAIINYYNELCDKEITEGFRFENNLVWLNMENQQNYKAAFDLAMMAKGQNGTLPLTFKFGTETESVYRTFKDLEDLQNFYISAVRYIQETLAKYWKIKDSIDWNTYKKLLNTEK